MISSVDVESEDLATKLALHDDPVRPDRRLLGRNRWSHKSSEAKAEPYGHKVMADKGAAVMEGGGRRT